MKLHRLALTDFRNYQRAVWEPRALVSVLHGPNGSGKTNLLEALSLLAPGRGLHGASLRDVCRLGSQQWGVVASLESRGERFRLATGVQQERAQRRVFLLDNAPVSSQSEVAERCSCVWLTPAMDRLFNEQAAQRRRFFDRLVVALLPDHAQQLMAHSRSLTSRNRVLATQPHQSAWLDSLEASISRHAVALTAARLSVSERLQSSFLTVNGFPSIETVMRCPLADKLATHPALHVEDWLRDVLKSNRDDDRAKAMTSVGAHRTDWTLINASDKREARFYSSGQQKIMLLSLILAHAHCVKQTWGEAPLILLDEPFVHLDERHRTALMKALQSLSTTSILTGTDADLFSPMTGWADFVRVEEGNLYPTSH